MQHMQQSTIIRQQVYGGTRISTTGPDGWEVERGEIRADRQQPGSWLLLDRNGRRLGTVQGDEDDAECRLIAATHLTDH